MKKFVMDTKVALGTAPKTEDQDYDRKVANVKSIEKAISDYKSAMEKMKSASQSVVSAMEAMVKVFNLLGNGEDSTEAMQGTAKDYEAAVKKINDEFLGEYKRAIDDNEDMTVVKDLAADCKKMESRRDSAMAEYDTYRHAVHTKEVDYKKKNKDLSDSKQYDDMVAKRDTSKEDFEQADKDFKEKYAEMEKEKIANFKRGMTAYLNGTSQFLDSISKELSPMAERVAEKDAEKGEEKDTEKDAEKTEEKAEE